MEEGPGILEKWAGCVVLWWRVEAESAKAFFMVTATH